MTTKWRESGAQVTITAAQAYTKGVLYFLNGIPAIALNNYENGETGCVFLTEGVFELPLNASDTATRGKVAYWDAGAGELVDAPDDVDCQPVGVFWNTSTGATAEVKLCSMEGQVLTLWHDQGDDGGALDLSAYAGPFDLCLTVDTQDGAVEVELPSCANMIGRRITVIRGGTGTNAITLDQAGSETINGSGTAVATLDAANDTLTLQANSPTNWQIVSSIIA